MKSVEEYISEVLVGQRIKLFCVSPVGWGGQTCWIDDISDFPGCQIIKTGRYKVSKVTNVLSDINVEFDGVPTIIELKLAPKTG